MAAHPLQYDVTLGVPGLDGGSARVLGPGYWQVRSLELVEALDTPYALTALLITEDLALDVEYLVGGTFALEITCPSEPFEASAGHARTVSGVVLRADYLGTHSKRSFVRVVVGPVLALLEFTRRSRVFQGRSVPEIVQQVVSEVFEPRHRTIRVDRLVGEHPERDYCVQWRETDLEFIHRILAEAGITYVWDTERSHETMVLLDANGTFAPLGRSPLVDDDGNTPTLVEVLTGGRAPGDVPGMSAFRWTRRIRTAEYVASSWDWKAAPPVTLWGAAEPAQPEAWEMGGHHVHGQGRLAETEGGAGPHLDATAAVAERAAARSATAGARAEGTGNLLAMTPGGTFELSGHPNLYLLGDYVVTRVVHRAEVPGADMYEGGVGAAEHYENTFEAIRLEVPYRPRLRARPRIHGPQLATVVGPADAEVHTDALGRVQVWMHWDREGEKRGDHETSCWLRVAQIWAGAGYGVLFFPRVGMEVVVQFLDGDPDRPLVTGCVYNGQNIVPDDGPTGSTRSTIRTASSPGGVAEGFNELRFEDARGSEEIYVHAQRDLTERIRNAHRTTVGGDQSLTVARDRAKVVEGEETRHIKGARHTHVGGSNTNLVVGSRTMQVGCAPDEEGGPAGLDELKVLGERSVYVQDRCFTEVGAAAGMTTSFEINPKEVIFRVPERFVVYVGDSKLEINRELLIGIARTCALQGSHGILQLADAAQLRSDNASIVAQGTAKLHLEQDRAVLDARRTLVAATQGNSGSSLALGADAQLEGAAVVLAETAVGESGCRIAEDGVTTTGVAITAEAKGVHTLKGATIDMN